MIFIDNFENCSFQFEQIDIEPTKKKAFASAGAFFNDIRSAGTSDMRDAPDMPYRASYTPTAHCGRIEMHSFGVITYARLALQLRPLCDYIPSLNRFRFG